LMSLETRLLEDMKKAMKEKDEIALSVIRFTRSAIQRYKVDNIKKELKEEEIEEILLGEAKKRRDSIHAFRDGKREDLVEKEEKELEVLSRYLPEQLSHDKLVKMIKEKIEELGARDKKDFSRVMKVVIPAFRGKADGKIIKDVVSELLCN